MRRVARGGMRDEGRIAGPASAGRRRQDEQRDGLVHLVEAGRALGLQALGQRAADRPLDVGGHEHRARGGQGLDARGDIDSVPEEVAVLGDPHLAEVRPDPDRRRGGRGQFLGRLQGAGDGGELQHEAVAGGVEQPPIETLAQRIDLAAEGGDLGGGGVLVGLGAGRIARHVDRDDRRQFPLWLHLVQRRPPRTLQADHTPDRGPA